MKTIPFQLELRPEIREVLGNADYKKFDEELRRIDELIILSGLEQDFVERSVRRYIERAKSEGLKVKKGHVCQRQFETPQNLTM